MHHLFLSACLQNSFFFSFQKLMRCLGMDFVGFILLRIHSVSGVCRFMSFTEFKKFSAITSSNPLSVPLAFSSPCGTSTVQILDLLLLSHKSLSHYDFFSNLFFLCYLNWVISIVLSSYSTVLELEV